MKALKAGALRRAQAEDVKCVSGMFNVPKKPDEAHPEGSWRLFTNLRNVNAFIKTTHFRLPTLLELAPLLYTGAWVCQLDLKKCPFSLPDFSQGPKVVVGEAPW